MSVSFNGFNEKHLTFKTATGKIAAGKPVTVSANSTVAASADSAAFAGFVTDCDDNYATVQISGYVKTKYSSTAPTLGYVALAANSNGGVKKVTSGGRNCLVLSVDSTSSTVEFIF